MNTIIMHIDVNSAFLSWTAVDLLKKGYHDIRKECSVIAGDESKRRGVVLAKSDIAKKCGIKSAETLYSARRKNKFLKVYPPNFNVYHDMSNKLFNLIKTYTDDIEIVSVDECFINYSNVKKLYGDEIKFAYKLKDEIYNKFGFTVNIGIANNKLCAKMASDFEKPNKVHTLFDNEIKNKMFPLPIGDLYGVGRSTSAKLINLGINTIGDLANTDFNKLYPYFKNQTKHLIDIANGIGSTEIIKEISDPKCMSMTNTLLYDYDDINDIYNELSIIANKLTKDLRSKDKYTNVVAVIMRDTNFNTISRQKKLNNPTNSTSIILDTVKKLFKDNWDGTPIRLIGIRLDSLSDTKEYQISLFEDVKKEESNEVLDKTIDKLRKKYGDNIIKTK